MKTVVVIGKNFGDEGKGLVTASLSLSCGRSLIVKSNGGAQAGHTVEKCVNDIRFIHHQTGAGSEYGAATLWASTYHPDLYKLRDEAEEFEGIFGTAPVIYSEPEAAITTVDDVLINMALETERGDARHGSCGMGVNECCLRGAAGYALTVGEVCRLSEEELLERLKTIRREYSKARMKTIRGEYYLALLEDEEVLAGFAAEIKANTKYVRLTEADKGFLENFDSVIFENGQGLLLDEDNTRFAPHVTASKTGLTNPMRFLKKRGLTPDEVIYVTRPYVTRHGAGELPCECGREELGAGVDMTNLTNEWQGSIRYARHENLEEFMKPMEEDMKQAGSGLRPSLVITHMDETGGQIFFEDRTLTLGELTEKLGAGFGHIYVSRNRESFEPAPAEASCV